MRPPGSTIDVVEEWRGREWSRISHSIVEAPSDGGLVTYERRGTVGVYASSRGVPGRERLPRADRKLAALETLQVRMVPVPVPIDSLYFWEFGRHARVGRGWRDGEFLGWYVGFIRPPAVGVDRIVMMDLVLDALLSPEGSWTWKDREDFDEARRRGFVTEHEADEVLAEAARLQVAASQRHGAFSRAWDSWTPPPSGPGPHGSA